ncbi:gsl0351 [Gloeobacter violaceus PCC 7421]|uniref:Gsl0351 protein n=1 Tax=Gloeobacter violaceus (strain ATCC 29082 / PCC 7421) TaxID=251221 RepID=Q7NNQ9_GLOVI|nr:gsl0351 [Gloeobacter violaceus PCC 7421]
MPSVGVSASRCLPMNSRIRWVEEQFLEPEEVREILLKLRQAALPIVLVGGQAVHFWAMH